MILSHGGEYLLSLKDNQPTLHQLAQSKLAAVPDEWRGDWEKDHGCIECRRIAWVDLDQDISLFPGARQLIRVTREWIEGKSEPRCFITSLEREERSAARLAPPQNFPSKNRLTRQPPCTWSSGLKRLA